MHDASTYRDFALACHRALPNRIRLYLNARGIPDDLIERHLLGWNGGRITIPIPDRSDEITFFKLAKDPEDTSESPKMVATVGSSTTLYGWEVIARKPERLILCEGEFDRLVLEARGFPAVTSTGGAGSFRKEWAEAFASISEVFVCYDRDDAGRAGALRVARLIPHAKIVELPADLGESGDVTDFFVRLGRGGADFERLIQQALPAPPLPPPQPQIASLAANAPELASRVDRIKQSIPIEDIIGQHVELRPSGRNLVGRCPFHEDRQPSLVVFPQTRTFHCFGCRAGGDLISFLRLQYNLSFSEALDSLDRSFPRHDKRTAA